MIELKNVDVAFNKDYCALCDINLTAKEGDRIAIIGPSGSGKTTLLRLLAGLEKQKSGECYIKDTPINKINFAKDVSLGYLSTKAVFFEHKSVFKNLVWTLKVHKTPRKERKLKIQEILAEFDLKNLAKTKTKKLCATDRRIVQIARMALRPIEIILCDDIFAGTDAISQQKIKKALVKLLECEPKSKVFIMASQDENLCKDFVNKVIYIESGSFVEKLKNVK